MSFLLEKLFTAFISLWPIWAWFLSRSITGGLAQNTDYYGAALTAGPLCLMILARVSFSMHLIKHDGVYITATGSLISGVYGFYLEYGRWRPYLNMQGYDAPFILQHLDWPLIAVSCMSVLAPAATFMLASGHFWRWWSARKNKGVYGTADWMPLARAKHLFSRGSIVIGAGYLPMEKPHMGGDAPLLLFEPRGHLLTVAGSGGGKTVSVAVPNVLNWGGGLWSTTPRESLRKFAVKHVRRGGVVWRC